MLFFSRESKFFFAYEKKQIISDMKIEWNDSWKHEYVGSFIVLNS